MDLKEWLKNEERGHEKALREYYDPAEDEFVIVDIDHTRRPKLFLRHLNKLRKTRYIEDLENKRRRDKIAKLYNPSDEGGDSI